MYETKKNSARKEMYKYQKSSYQKNFHNTTHFNYHKYNKYKQKYNHSNSIQDYDEETIFSKIFDENKSPKNVDLKEVEELTPTPTIKTCKTMNENKENFSLNSNINNLETQLKTNEFNESIQNENNENLFSFRSNNCANFDSNFSEPLIFDENFSKNEIEIDQKEDALNDIKNLNNLNNINFNNNENINNINCNVENVINDLLQKSNEILYASNEKENIHLEYNKNVYKTPQPFKMNSSSSINLSSNDLKEAYYIPKKLSNIYDMYGTQPQPNLFERKRNSLNNFNFMTTIQKPTMSLSNKQIPSLGINSNLNLNYFKNNNNNNYLNFNSGSSNINLNNSFNIPNSPNIPIKSFNIFDSNNINSIGNIGNLNLSQCLNSNNSHHSMNKNPFHNMMPQLELNQCILKTQISNNSLFEKDKENTDILEINVKVSERETLTFKIRRYDDMFKTVKIFCEINKLDIKLIRPFIIYIIRALNSIYGIYNLNLKNDEIKFLKDIKSNYFNDEQENSESNDDDPEEKNEKSNNIDNEENICSFGDNEIISINSKDHYGENNTIISDEA